MLTSEINSLTVAVVGSVFLDLIYDCPLECSGAEPIQRFHGGIGRNIAENLGWIGLRPRLVTLMTPNNLGEHIATELACAGVELSAKYVSNGMGVYRAFVRAGETEQWRIEQPLIEQLDWHFVREHLRLASHVVVETGLDRDMMRELLVDCRRRGIPVYGVTTRLHELPVDQQSAIISRLDCVIMNCLEAEAVLSRRITNSEAAIQAVTELQRNGVPQAVITMGAEGAAAGGYGSPPAFYKTVAACAVSTLGCGDAFTAGFVAASAAGYTFPEAIKAALELARRTAGTAGPVCARAGRDLLSTAKMHTDRRKSCAAAHYDTGRAIGPRIRVSKPSWKTR